MPRNPDSQSSSRRSFLRNVAGTLGTSALAAAGPLTGSRDGHQSTLHFAALTENATPNILYIHSHDTGRYTQAYGFDVPTPHLDRLAKEGLCFSNAFCQAPTCSPSRASLLTGQCSHANGMLGLANRGFKLNDYHKHIIHTLRERKQYRSTLIGLQHIADDASVIGYDEVVDVPGNHARDVARHAVQFFRSKPKGPFWLSVGFFETHRPFLSSSDEDDAKHILPPSTLSNLPEIRGDMSDFHATLRAMDDGVGSVLDALLEAGLAENTLVLSTTDHGIAFPDMKCNLTDAGLGVHLVMRGPGGFDGGEVCDALVSQIDIFPTICELLGIDPPEWLEGRSFLPVIEKKKAEVNDAIFAELNFHASYEPLRAVRTKRWKYIRNFGSAHPVLPNCDDSPSKSVWVDHGWLQHVRPAEQLYDLLFDPHERNNLVSVAENASVLKQMRATLHRWMEQTHDPLLRGPIQPPHGTQVNPPGQTSPNETPTHY